MTNIKAVVANVPVANLEDALPLYQALADTDTPYRFEYKGLRLARVGPFLLIEGDMSSRPRQDATVLVESIAAVLQALEESGAEILEGPGEVANGMRLQARHPDGAIFEYLQS